MKNVSLGHRTIADIDGPVDKVLRGLGDPEPPIDLRIVRDLLKLDRGYYSTTDDSLLRETFSRMKVAGLQVLLRPTILREAAQTLSLKALYLPDQKRILLDQDLPVLKHHWNEAHEIGHDRAGPGCLNSNSASISGVSARVRLPRGTAAG